MAVDKNMNILVVDDMRTMIRIIENILRQLGFKNIHSFTEAEAALKDLKEKKYDLVLSDWNMEPMSGIDFLKAVRADEQLKSLPFILITAESKPENIIAAKQAGVNNYIVKPFNVDTVKAKLTAVIGAF